MKRRLTPIITVSIALILVGSLAYAADRRKNAKQLRQPVDPAHEQEALRAELLEAVDGLDKKQNNTVDSVKSVSIRAGKKSGRERKHE